MILFHITNQHHIVQIFLDQQLTTTESNIGAPKVRSLAMHRQIAESIDASDNEVNPDDPPLVMVKYKDQVLTIPRDLLAKAEKRNINLVRLTQKEIAREVGDAETYKARVVVSIDFDKEANCDFLIETNASGEDLSPYGEHVGPDVVWLTRDTTPRQGWARPHEMTVFPEETTLPSEDARWEGFPRQYRKDAVLIAVDVPDEEVHKWSEWAFEHGINPKWYEAMTLGLDEHEDWYVVERPIDSTEWVGVWDLYTGHCAWLPPGTLPEGYQDEIGVPHDEYTTLVPIPDSWVPSRLLTKTTQKKKP